MTGEDVEPADAEAFRKGHDAGSTDERSRIRTILMHPEAKDREAAAFDLAFGTDLAAVKAAEVLSRIVVSPLVIPRDRSMSGERVMIRQAVMAEGGHLYLDNDGKWNGDRKTRL